MGSAKTLCAICSLKTKYENEELLIPKTWLSVKQAADYLCTTKGGIYNLVYRGRLRPHCFGRRHLFKRTELDQFIESSRRGAINNGYSRSF